MGRNYEGIFLLLFCILLKRNTHTHIQTHSSEREYKTIDILELRLLTEIDLWSVINTQNNKRIRILFTFIWGSLILHLYLSFYFVSALTAQCKCSHNTDQTYKIFRQLEIGTEQTKTNPRIKYRNSANSASDRHLYIRKSFSTQKITHHTNFVLICGCVWLASNVKVCILDMFRILFTVAPPTIMKSLFQSKMTEILTDANAFCFLVDIFEPLFLLHAFFSLSLNCDFSQSFYCTLK